MTNTIEFLSKLHELGVELRVDGERLRLNAPKGVLSAALKEEIADRKEEILLFLRNVKGEESSGLVINSGIYQRRSLTAFVYPGTVMAPGATLAR